MSSTQRLDGVWWQPGADGEGPERHSPPALIEADANGVIEVWEGVAEQEFGWTAEDIANRQLTIFELVIVATGSTSQVERLRRLREIGSWEGIAFVRTKAGNAVPAVGTVQTDRDGGEISRYRIALQTIDHRIEGWQRRRLEPYFTLEEVAKAWRVNEKTVRGWVKDGLLKAHMVGHMYRFSASDLEEFMANTRTSKMDPQAREALKAEITERQREDAD